MSEPDDLLLPPLSRSRSTPARTDDVPYVTFSKSIYDPSYVPYVPSFTTFSKSLSSLKDCKTPDVLASDERRQSVNEEISTQMEQGIIPTQQTVTLEDLKKELEQQRKQIEEQTDRRFNETNEKIDKLTEIVTNALKEKK